jgi:glycosyltransferase involved in cell wall biosynthesis
MYLNRKKRFLFVMGFTCPFPGAGWWRIFYFARHFKEKGHKSYILSCISPGTLNSPRVVRKENINIYNMIPSIQLNKPFFLFLNNIFALIAIFPFFLLIRPNVVIISVPPADQLIPLFILSKIMRCKLVIDYRDEFEDYLIMHTRKWSFFYRFLKKILSYLYRNAALVTPVTPAIAENLKRRGICNVKVIYDGVDTTIFQPFNKSKMRSEFHLPQDSFVIAYLGNVYNPYRVDIVIRALKKLNEKDPKRKYLLVLVGGGDVKSVLNLARSLEISDSVKYFGVIKNPTEITKILSSADCGIIPYDDNPLWQKTYSTKLFEYCAIGLPVIATVHEDSALAVVIKTNKMGLITPPINSDALAFSLETLSADKESSTKMSLSALQFARTYDKEELARDLLEAIESWQ